MSTFFQPYEGKRPFLFISYAHRQSDAVVDTIRILKDRGYRLWYDEGIPAGSDWPANIARHMQDCERVIFFLSERSMESQNCFSEIRTAYRLKKPILIVRLEEAETNEDWRELLNGSPEVPILAGPEERADAILRTGFLSRRFHRSRAECIPWRTLGLAASLIFFLAAAGAFGTILAGALNPPAVPVTVTPAPQVTQAPVPTATPDTSKYEEASKHIVVSFPDWLQENAIREAIGAESGDVHPWDIVWIEELCLCGNMVLDGTESIVFDADGRCFVGGAKVAMGPVSDLSLLQYAYSLKKLVLACQPLEDLNVIGGLSGIRELNLAGSTVSSLSGLKDSTGLEILRLEHTGVRDLTPLEGLGNLKTVTVSRDMLPLTWSESAGFLVILVD